MKAEHRKELHTNALAAHLARLIEGFKSRPNPRALTIWVFILLAVGLFAGWRFVSKYNETKRSEEWRRLDEAASLADLNRLAQEAKGTMPGRIAEFQTARVQLMEGLQRLGTSGKERAAAVKQVREAGELYERLAEASRKEPILAQEALMNAGKAKESLGDVDGAVALYEKLAQAYPKSPLGKLADERAKKITAQRSQVVGFYQELEDLTTKKE